MHAMHAVFGQPIEHSLSPRIHAMFAAELGIALEFSGHGTDEIATVAAVSGDKAPAIKAGDVVMRIDPRYFRPAEVDRLQGDAGKARRKLDWKPETTFQALVTEMVAEDLKAMRQELRNARHD